MDLTRAGRFYREQPRGVAFSLWENAGQGAAGSCSLRWSLHASRGRGKKKRTTTPVRPCGDSPRTVPPGALPKTKQEGPFARHGDSQKRALRRARCGGHGVWCRKGDAWGWVGIVTRIRHVEKGKLRNKMVLSLFLTLQQDTSSRRWEGVGSALPGSRLESRELKLAGKGRGQRREGGA